jgi:hypothetical protein
MLTPYDVLRMAERLGVVLRTSQKGTAIHMDGPQAARDELRPLVVAFKVQLLELFRLTRYDRPADAPGERWERDWRGILVNLAPKPAGWVQ